MNSSNEKQKDEIEELRKQYQKAIASGNSAEAGKAYRNLLIAQQRAGEAEDSVQMEADRQKLEALENTKKLSQVAQAQAATQQAEPKRSLLSGAFGVATGVNTKKLRQAANKGVAQGAAEVTKETAVGCATLPVRLAILLFLGVLCLCSLILYSAYFAVQNNKLSAFIDYTNTCGLQTPEDCLKDDTTKVIQNFAKPVKST